MQLPIPDAALPLSAECSSVLPEQERKRVYHAQFILNKLFLLTLVPSLLSALSSRSALVAKGTHGLKLFAPNLTIKWRF